MRKNFLAFLFFIQSAFSLSVSPQDAAKIGNKIWKNECNGSVDLLVNWKKGENFVSLGIGHFIWYSAGKEERFQEAFPELLKFLTKEGATVPDWLKDTNACPWNSREEFYSEINSSKMKSLRQFLFDTKDLQAIYIANRLEVSFSQILEHCSKTESAKMKTLFAKLTSSANGLYALIDYLNFKGAGISSSEVYQGQGWGLLQVLRGVSQSSEKPLVDFVQSAKSVLSQRVKNSPPERNEAQWLKGWHNRLDTYLSASL